MIDKITKPFHYQFRKPCLEVRDVIRDRCFNLINKLGRNKAALLAYDYSNSIKYLLRWTDKNGIEDLKKARYCIDCMIEEYEKYEISKNKETISSVYKEFPCTD